MVTNKKRSASVDIKASGFDEEARLGEPPRSDKETTELLVKRAERWSDALLPDPKTERGFNLDYYTECEHLDHSDCTELCREQRVASAVQFAREILGLAKPSDPGPVAIRNLTRQEIRSLEDRRDQRVADQRKAVSIAHQAATNAALRRKRGEAAGDDDVAVLRQLERRAMVALSTERRLLRRLTLGHAPLAKTGAPRKLAAVVACSLVEQALRDAEQSCSLRDAVRLIWSDDDVDAVIIRADAIGKSAVKAKSAEKNP